MSEIKSQKRRGRPPGTKNKPGHMVGRPPNGRYGAAATPKPRWNGPPSTGEDLGCPLTSNKIPYRVVNPISTKVPYITPMPCTDGHNCPGNGNGGRLTVDDNPSRMLPAKNLPLPQGRNGVLSAVCQSGLNPKIITAEELILEIQKVATVEAWMFFDENGAPLPLNKLPSIAAAAVSSYSAQPITYEGRVLMDPRDPEGKTPLYKISLACWNKNTAQDQLARYHGLYAKDREQGRPNINIPIQVNRVDLSDFSLEEMQNLLKLGLKIAEVNGSPVLDLSPELFGEIPSGVPVDGTIIGAGDEN